MRSRRLLPTLTVLLVTLGPALGLSLAIRMVARGGAALAGPIEAKRLYDEARLTRKGPWPEAARAYRRVLDEAGRADAIRARALKAIAGVFQGAALPHGAQAARQRAVHASGQSAASYRLALARGLLAEEDLQAARPLLEELARLGRHRAPREVSAALVLLARDAFDRGARTELTRFLQRMEKQRLPQTDQMTAWSQLGLLYLDAGEGSEAKRCLKEARRAGAAGQASADEAAARKATRLWLDLPLRKALSR